MTPLVLDPLRVPKGTDVAQTIAGEVIVSARAFEALTTEAVTGARFEPVRFPSPTHSTTAGWFQLRTTAPLVTVDPVSQVGRTPFDDLTPEDVCPRGDRLGYPVISELFVKGPSYVGADFVATRQFVGVRRGLLRPNPILMMSTRAWLIWQAAKLKGMQFEVVHLI